MSMAWIWLQKLFIEFMPKVMQIIPFPTKILLGEVHRLWTTLLKKSAFIMEDS